MQKSEPVQLQHLLRGKGFGSRGSSTAIARPLTQIALSGSRLHPDDARLCVFCPLALKAAVNTQPYYNGALYVYDLMNK